MNKILLILLCFSFFYSCGEKNKMTEKNKINDVVKSTVISFNVTSKNSDLTSNSGKDVSLNEMVTIVVKSEDIVEFNGINITLDNKVDGALNFNSFKGSLFCIAPTKLSTMSMPPNGEGLINYNSGDNFEVSGMTLIKINSVNLVISDIKID